MKNRKAVILIAIILAVVVLRETGFISLNRYHANLATYSGSGNLDHIKESGDIGLVTIYRGTADDLKEGKAVIIHQFTAAPDGKPLDFFIYDDTYAADWTLWIPLVKQGKQKLYINAEPVFNGRPFPERIQFWIAHTKVIGICSRNHLKRELYRTAFASFERQLRDS